MPRGYRESGQSWKELLLDLKARGLEEGPELPTGDGALGFWKALAQVYPKTRQQRCWVHKTANVLNKLPRSQQPAAKDKLHQIWMVATKAQAIKAFDGFIEIYKAKYPQAAECMGKDREQLLAFYGFPAEHWQHIRTSKWLLTPFPDAGASGALWPSSGFRREVSTAKPLDANRGLDKVCIESPYP